MKNFILSLSLLFAAGPLYSQSISILEGGPNVGGYMPECISPDGTYVGGSTLATAMFISEWADNNTFLVTTLYGSSFANYGAEIRSVNNSGLGVGFDDNGAVVVDFANEQYKVIQKVNTSEGIYDAIADAVSEDGSVISGVVVGAGWFADASVWIDGELQYLPLPAFSEVGFQYEGSRAAYMSSDASVIVGFLVDGLNTRPMVVWHRQDDGSYICDPVCKNYFEPGTGDNLYRRFSPLALSPDGSKVAMMLQVNSGTSDSSSENLLGIYNVSDGTVEPVYIDGKHGIPAGSLCEVYDHGISDDGTVVGWYYNMFEDRLAFIMYPDEMQPMPLSRAFPELEKLAEYDEIGEHALSGISADARYICGMGVVEDPSFGYIYEGYVLDTQGSPESGVGEIMMAPTETEKRYFSIDGKEVASPVNGITIVRNPDGSTSKIIR